MNETFKIIKEFISAIRASDQNKTQPYDTQGTVKRVEGDTAWVEFTSGDRETPVQMTIACEKGDIVQVRVGGGGAWLTGNLTAPPTDDKKAVQALTMAETVVQKIVEEVAEALEEVEEAIDEIPSVEGVTIQYCLSSSASTFTQYGDWSDTLPAYVSGKYYWTRTVIEDDEGNVTYGDPQYSQSTQLSVETERAFSSNNNHFWYDSSGAYVTTADKNYSNGYATRITNSGILQTYNGNTLSSWTGSGVAFYDTYGDTLASFGAGGVYLYANDSLGVGITSSGISLYASGVLGALLTSSGMTIYANGTDVASFGSTVRLGSTSGNYLSLGSSNITFNGGQIAISGKKIQIGGVDAGDDYINIGVNSYGATYIDPGSSSAGLTVMSAGGTMKGVSAKWLVTDTSVDVGSYVSTIGRVEAGTRFKSEYCYTETISTDNRVAITSNGNMGRYSSSSRRYKERIEDSTFDPHGLYDLKARQFVYKDGYFALDDDNPHAYDLQVGFIAEEVNEHYPAATVYDTNTGEVESWSERKIIPPMLTLIQELNDRVLELERRLT